MPAIVKYSRGLKRKDVKETLQSMDVGRYMYIKCTICHHSKLNGHWAKTYLQNDFSSQLESE